MKLTRHPKVVEEGVFGSLDGFNSAIAVIFGTSHVLFILALTISVGGALSMAAGSFVSALSDPEVSARDELPSTVAMGLCTFVGTFLPCVPALIFPRAVGIVLALVMGLLLSVFVGRVNGGARKDYLIVLCVFVVVLIPTALIGLLA
jgi:VIT1/CCC1 family predicted Fe2+/Mn2+ transporter